MCVWFTNDERGLVLNKTNNRTIRGAFGDDTANWVGKIIVVFPTMADVRGKMTPALRVRIPPPKQATAACNSRQTPQQPVQRRGNGAAAARRCCGASCGSSAACRGGAGCCGSGA